MIRGFMASSSLREGEVNTVRNLFEKLFEGFDVRAVVKGGSAFVSVDKGEKHVADFRVAKEVVELYLRVGDAGLDVLKGLGFEDLYEVFSGLGVPAEMVISKSPASRSVYLLVKGEHQRIPNIRIVVRDGSREAVASYCRVGSDCDTCALLSKLLNICERLWREFFGK